MELTKSEKSQNLKTYMKRLTKTLSIFNVEDSKEEFRKQLHQLHHQAKKMGKQYPQLATPLKFILSSSLKVDKFSKFNTMARETLLRRMYEVTREMNETLHLHRDRDRREKLLDLQHYCQTDMPIAQKEYLQIVSIALALKE